MEADIQASASAVNVFVLGYKSKHWQSDSPGLDFFDVVHKYLISQI